MIIILQFFCFLRSFTSLRLRPPQHHSWGCYWWDFAGWGIPKLLHPPLSVWMDYHHTCSLSLFQSLLSHFYFAHAGNVELEDKGGILKQQKRLSMHRPYRQDSVSQGLHLFVSWHIQSVPILYRFPLFFIPRFHSNHHMGLFSARHVYLL